MTPCRSSGGNPGGQTDINPQRPRFLSVACRRGGMNGIPVEKEDKGERRDCPKHPSHCDRTRCDLRVKESVLREEPARGCRVATHWTILVGALRILSPGSPTLDDHGVDATFLVLRHETSAGALDVLH